jgi:hypothetical protein
MRQDFGWSQSANEYLSLYRSLLHLPDADQASLHYGDMHMPSSWRKRAYGTQLPALAHRQMDPKAL